MGHTFGDGIIVAAVAAVVIAYFYFRDLERRRRLEIVHLRLAAMEKGIPLAELPPEPQIGRPPNPRAPLVHGLVWTALGAGSMVALSFVGERASLPLGTLPLPLLLLGAGLVLSYFLTVASARPETRHGRR